MRSLCLLVLVVISLNAVANDPFEPVNRKIQKFNDVADEKIVRPIAKGYSRLPGPVLVGLGNVYGNLEDVGDAVNNLLQGKPAAGISDIVRVTINTTIGLGGLFDPASRLGLKDHEEDFAQTLARWQVPRGPYLVIPLLGPSSLRDVFARPVNSKLDPLMYLHPVDHRNTLIGMRLLHQRADLLTADSVVFGDRYIFFREAFKQRREYLENDGVVEDPFDDEFDEDF